MPTSMAKGCRCRRSSPLITIAGAVPPSRSICIRAILPTRRTAPCPAPRARELVAPIDAFHDQARRLGVPITILRKRGVDDINGLKAAWRLVFPLYVGNIPNANEHGIEGTRWTEFVTRVEPEDL